MKYLIAPFVSASLSLDCATQVQPVSRLDVEATLNISHNPYLEYYVRVTGSDYWGWKVLLAHNMASEVMNSEHVIDPACTTGFHRAVQGKSQIQPKYNRLSAPNSSKWTTVMIVQLSQCLDRNNESGILESQWEVIQISRSADNVLRSHIIIRNGCFEIAALQNEPRREYSRKTAKHFQASSRISTCSGPAHYPSAQWICPGFRYRSASPWSEVSGWEGRHYALSWRHGHGLHPYHTSLYRNSNIST